ncbi:hypothetical protein AMATHDRAFT_2706 [Amanita thiersii Skay4041]|uniref:Phosphatidic acid phosphatase type 2/haloperoxidase domain-containing protein n=1 Tax=Amanita thiersii Skay4041 TaxID=703135 RepID=A0A2A9NVS5_9AGAR|nr:hypothetical protein AMATHDRAFT_2706 [Amanita thiersii Skay4041]
MDFVYDRLRHVFGRDALDWFDKSYFVDWGVTLLIWFLSFLINLTPVFERDINLGDISISHPHKKNTVGSPFNHWVALLVPILVISFGGVRRRSLVAIHHGVISVCAARGLARLVTVFMKHTVDRLRPDFLDRCKWDAHEKVCTGKLEDVINGRESFPSGHSSTVFSGMTVLSLWIAGQTAAWCSNAPNEPTRIPSSRMASLSLTTIPLFWAVFVAISRVEDNRHHPEDVVVGSIIGILCAILCYNVFWPNVFAARSFTQDVTGQPRLLYTESLADRDAVNTFGLTRIEDGDIEEGV